MNETFNLQTLKQAVTESGLRSSARSQRIAVNDYIDEHPGLRADLVEIAADRDTYRRVYDQQRHMEDTIRTYDQANGSALAQLDIEPSRLIEYARDRVNAHLQHAGYRIARGRIEPLQLADQSDQSED
jgi:hypothetical protein